MKNSIAVFDNFLENPFLIRLLSFTQNFYSIKDHPNKNIIQKFPGKRTEDLSIINPHFFKFFILRMSSFVGYENIGIQSSLTFSYLTEKSLIKSHTDVPPNFSKKIYAGVLYLNKNIKPEYGTIVGDKKIEARYNRLILYDGSILHSPMKGFGNNKFNSRMTLNIFYELFNWHSPPHPI